MTGGPETGLRGARVLVTGAGGFVGASLVPELLRCGVEVHALSRGATTPKRLAALWERIVLHSADVSDLPALAAVVDVVRPDFIFHLAVQRDVSTTEGRAAAVSTNLVGTANLLETGSRIRYKRFVHLGSSLEYGPRDGAARESDTMSPTSFYGATKAGATILCRQAALARKWPIVVLRPYLLYGPWDSPHHLIPAAILASLNGSPLPLTRPGFRRDWIFVDDVVDACLRAASSDRADGEVINVGTGRQWTNEAVVARVEAVTGRRIDVRPGAYPPRPTDTSCWVADVRKAREILGWQPCHALEDGIRKTFAWMQHAAGRTSAS
jgi:nucleoside-diphosphate-sugar epimerase